MNEWAKHHSGEFDRRVSRRQFAEVLGCGITWFRVLEKKGAIPRGRRDPGGKRLWWLASEVAATLERLKSEAQEAA